jgi:HAD superfamily hydrolase (TIGR01490 family)
MNNTKPNLVIYDFCETIVSIQTADRFINFCLENNKKKSIITVIEKLLTVGRFFAIVNLMYPKLNLSKRINLFKIRGFDESQLQIFASKYYKDIIKPCFNLTILDILKQDITDNNKIVVIVSGGYNFYLQLFCEEFGINYLLSSKIEIVNGKATGFLNDKDCLFEEKVNLLNRLIKEKKIEFNHSIVYTDSITDLPILNWANEKYVISYNKSQKWALDNKFSEIILTRNNV